MKNFYSILKDLAKSKQLTITHVIQNCILRGMKIGNRTTDKEIAAKVSLEMAGKFLRRSFTPITRKVKLDNGRLPYDTVRYALSTVLYDCMRYFDNDAEFEQYKTIVSELRKQYSGAELIGRSYVYIFVRQDIFPEYQAVQACHVAAKMGFRLQGRLQGKFKDNLFDELYFTLVGVPSISALETAIADIKAVAATAYEFREPDIGNELTAVASSPIYANQRKRLLSYKLLKFKDLG